jgi:hypothetical protein
VPTAFDAGWKQVAWINLEAQPTADWKQFSHKVSLPDEAAHLIFYFWAKGEGTAWLDNLEVSSQDQSKLTAQQRGAVQPGPVTNLKAVHRGGQTFLTWNEIPGRDVTYQFIVPQPKSMMFPKLQPVANVPQGSGRYLITGQNFVIENGGQPLSDNTSLLVWTSEADGKYFYAVANSTDTKLNGGNNLATPVEEKFAAVPGVVQVDGKKYFCLGKLRHMEPGVGLLWFRVWRVGQACR